MSNTNSLRIDYSKYQVDEVTETIANAIFFPVYISKVLVTNLVVLWLLLTVICFFYRQYISKYCVLVFSFYYLYSITIIIFNCETI